MNGSSVPEESTVDVDAVLKIIANRRRRFVIHILKRESDTVTITGLAVQIAAWENGVPTAQVSGRTRKSVYTALRQTHLPKMSDVGMVNFRKDRGLVEPTQMLAELDVYIDIENGHNFYWPAYYMILAFAGASLVFGTYFGMCPFTVAPMLWSGAFVATLGLSAAVHGLYVRRTHIESGTDPPERGFVV